MKNVHLFRVSGVLCSPSFRHHRLLELKYALSSRYLLVCSHSRAKPHKTQQIVNNFKSYYYFYCELAELRESRPRERTFSNFSHIVLRLVSLFHRFWWDFWPSIYVETFMMKKWIQVSVISRRRSSWSLARHNARKMETNPHGWLISFVMFYVNWYRKLLAMNLS